MPETNHQKIPQTKMVVRMENKYVRTTDVKKMLTNKQLDEAIENDWENIKDFLPCRTSTYIKYKAGSREAYIWNEGEEKEKIYLPLEDGWYIPDEKYGIPNGKKSTFDNLKARYLWRYQDKSFSGPVGFGYGFDGDGGRSFNADVVWRDGSGVAFAEKIDTQNTYDTCCSCGDKMTCKQEREALENALKVIREKLKEEREELAGELEDILNDVIQDEIRDAGFSLKAVITRLKDESEEKEGDNE